MSEVVIVASAFGADAIRKEGHHAWLKTAAQAGAAGFEVRRELFALEAEASSEALSALGKSIAAKDLWSVYSTPAELYRPDGALDEAALRQALIEATALGARFVKMQLGGFAGRFVTNLLTSMLGWRHALDIVALLSFATGLAIYASLPASGAVRAEGGSATKAQWKLAMRGPVLASFAVGACVLASQVATFTFVGLRLTRAPFGFSTAGIGAIYAVFLVAMVVTPISGRMARHRGPRDLALAAVGLAVVGSLLTLPDSVGAILVGLALGSTAVFVEQACANAFISHAAARARTTAIGIYLSCYYLGGSLGSVLPIPAWHRWGWAGCVAFVVAAQALVGLLVFAFWRPERAAARSDARGAPGQSPG